MRMAFGLGRFPAVKKPRDQRVSANASTVAMTSGQHPSDARSPAGTSLRVSEVVGGLADAAGQGFAGDVPVGGKPVCEEFQHLGEPGRIARIKAEAGHRSSRWDSAWRAGQVSFRHLTD
jgi:hypothetical protein